VRTAATSPSSPPTAQAGLGERADKHKELQANADQWARVESTSSPRGETFHALVRDYSGCC
jgi:hypothetical protein